MEDHSWDEVAAGLRVTVSLGYAVLTSDMDTPESCCTPPTRRSTGPRTRAGTGEVHDVSLSTEDPRRYLGPVHRGPSS